MSWNYNLLVILTLWDILLGKVVLINNMFLFKGHNTEDKCSETGYCACGNPGNWDTARIMKKISLTFDPAVFSCS